MNVNKVLTKDYENKTLGESGKNKANSNPNKANLQKAKMNVSVFYTKNYENKSTWVICENKANFNPKQSQTKPIYRGVASGEDGSNPISEAKKSGEQMNRRKDEQVTSGKDKQVTKRKEKGEVCGKIEN